MSCPVVAGALQGTVYRMATPLVMERIIEEHLLGGRVVEDHLVRRSRAALPALLAGWLRSRIEAAQRHWGCGGGAETDETVVLTAAGGAR
jgi:(2Fe-2S) ferredoxin